MYFCHPSVLACVKLCGYRQQRDSFTGPKEKVSFDISNGQIYVEKLRKNSFSKNICKEDVHIWAKTSIWVSTNTHLFVCKSNIVNHSMVETLKRCTHIFVYLFLFNVNWDKVNYQKWWCFISHYNLVFEMSVG